MVGSKSKVKSFEIDKRLVHEAWMKVQANGGAPGVDAVSIGGFREAERDNLYKLWNPVSSGSYRPGPVRAVEIPKDHGAGIRVLGVPNVADRIAQTAAAMLLEEKLEPIFHPDSYGYRPGRSAHDALAVTRRRCWKQDWVLDLDVRAFFDSVPHDLLLKAVAHHTDERWVLLYIERWLTAPMQMPDRYRAARDGGPRRGRRSPRCWPTCSCITRLMPGWFGNFRAVPSRGMRMTLSLTATPRIRPARCGTRSPPSSGHSASSCSLRRRRSCSVRTRTGRGKRSTPASTSSAIPSGGAWPKAGGATSSSFAPAISVTAAKAVGQKVRAWHLNRRRGTRSFRPGRGDRPSTVRGWIGYYGAFYRSGLYSLARHIDEHLVRWAMQKFKRLRGKAAKARAWLDAVRQHQPRLFAHWHLLPPTRGRPVGAV